MRLVFGADAQDGVFAAILLFVGVCFEGLVVFVLLLFFFGAGFEDLEGNFSGISMALILGMHIEDRRRQKTELGLWL